MILVLVHWRWLGAAVLVGVLGLFPWVAWELAWVGSKVRAWGGFAVLLAVGVAANEVFHAVAATYVLLVAAFVPPLLAVIEASRRFEPSSGTHESPH
jgi:hypothetical protein